MAEMSRLLTRKLRRYCYEQLLLGRWRYWGCFWSTLGWWRALIPALVLALVGVFTWGRYWKVKLVPDSDFCTARIAYCLRNGEADEFTHEIERMHGEALSDPALWCRCASDFNLERMWTPP